MSEIATFNQTLTSCLLEAVRSPHSRHLLLHFCKGRRFTTAGKISCDGSVFVPQQLDDGLVQAVSFPPPSEPFGTVHDLTSSMCACFLEHARLTHETAFLLVAFAFATWFCDVVDVAPILDVFGPEIEVSRCLRLLACFCRRSLLLGYVDLGSLRTLPKGLAATLIINQRELSDRLTRVLQGSNRRHFGLAHGNGRMDLYGAKVFARAETVPGLTGLDISLPPAHEPLPPFSDVQQDELSRHFQARLLRYRLLSHDAVRQCRVDFTEFAHDLREQGHSWLAPVNGNKVLMQQVTAALKRRSGELRSSRFTDPRHLIAEAALHYCHVKNVDPVFVGDIGEAANTLLAARHEQPTLSARRTGAILREFGIAGEREARGFRIELNASTRERIHRFASSYGVLSCDGIARCSHCARNAEVSEGSL